MLIHRVIAAALIAATPLAAQSAACVVGPGALLGIVGYQCANCAFKQQVGASPSVTFFSEPVVTETQPGSMIANGDVIIAVDGNPITTQAGADRFVHPATGTHTLTVRRGRDRQDIRIDLETNCTAALVRGSGSNAGGGPLLGRGVSGSAASASASGGIGVGSTGSNASGAGGRASSLGKATSNVGGKYAYDVTSGFACDSLPALVRLRGFSRSGGAAAVGDTLIVPSDPLIIVDGVVVGPVTRGHESGGRFGFAVNSVPVCRVVQVDGKRRYNSSFDDYPAIYAVRPDSPADKAGLRVGDVIVKVEGESVLDHPGLLTGADERNGTWVAYNQLHMTVRRDGKEIAVVMVATP